MRKLVVVVVSASLAFALSGCGEMRESTEEKLMRLSIECLKAGGEPEVVPNALVNGYSAIYCATKEKTK